MKIIDFFNRCRFSQFVPVFCLCLSFQLFASEAGWNSIGNEDGIHLYKKEAKNGIIPFRAKAKLNLPINDLSATLFDLKNKNKWSPKLKNVKVHKKINEQSLIFSEYYETPWPATDREFLMKGEVKGVGSTVVSFKAKSIFKQSEMIKWRDVNHIQAEVLKIDVELRELSANTTSITFEFHGDLKGWMPKWLTNMIQKKWPKLFIQKLVEFTKEENKKKV